MRLVAVTLTLAVILPLLAWRADRADGATCRYPKISRKLDRYLRTVGSPAAGQACVIAEEAIRRGWHPAFVVAAAGTESSYWTHACHGNPLNGWGLASCTGTWHVPYFRSWRHAVRFYAAFLSERFPRATTTYSFHGYAACASCWGAATARHLARMGFPNRVRWPW